MRRTTLSTSIVALLLGASACAEVTESETVALEGEDVATANQELTGGQGPRDLFALSSRTASTEVTQAWNAIFNSPEQLYNVVDSDEARCLDPSGPWVKSEGQSYCMMIAVLNDKKTEFDMLWRYANSRMRHTSGSLNGYFAWLVRGDHTFEDQNPAPDGEVWFAAALYMANARWGSGSSPLNYQQQADGLVDLMRVGPTGGAPMFDPTNKLIRFGVVGTSQDYTDPSYMLPAFLQMFANNATNSASFWTDATTAARSFLQSSTNANGLTPDYAEFSGSPVSCSAHGAVPNCGVADADTRDFRNDAPRTIMNMAQDYTWHNGGAFESTDANAYLTFFQPKRGAGTEPTYAPYWSVSTSTAVTPLTYDNRALMASLGAACQAVDFSSSNGCVKAVQDIADRAYLDSSKSYRYYYNLLMALATFHAAGKFIDHSRPCGSRTFRVENKNDVKWLRVVSGLPELAATSNTGNDTKWTMIPAGGGWYYLQNSATGTRLSRDGATTPPEVKMVSGTTTSDEAKWKLLSSSLDGYYRLQNKYATSYPWLKNMDGTDVEQADTSQNGDRTRWALKCQ
jgi:oligosaccharide reducing-end xylanase